MTATRCGGRRGARLLLLPLVSVALLLSACTLRELGREIRALERLGQIAGETISVDGPGAPTLVVLHALRGTRPVMVNYRVQVQPGPFAFVPPPGRYIVVAFEDLDRDFVWSPGEPLSPVGPGSSFTLEPGASVTGVELRMSRDEKLAGGLELDLTHRSSNRAISPERRNVGVVASLDDERFSAERGRKAAASPIRALASGGVGVFFVEPFDPHRIPVLFVHGINGSPQDLRPLIEDLDRERFQAWFVAYPSTLPLQTVADFMHESVLDLGVTYDLRRLYVVAHSMGGLVSRAFINQNVALKRRELVQLFITLATPFGGHPSASVIESVPGALKPRWISGVSWVDMVPESKFLHDLYYEPLAPYVEHHLFWGWQADSRQRGGGDGVIPLSSQLDTRAEAVATTYPEPASHTGILESARVHARIRAILDAAWERDHTALRPERFMERTVTYLSAESDFDFDLQGDAGAGQEERMREFEELLADRADAIRTLLTSASVQEAVTRVNAEPASSDPDLLRERDRQWRGGDAETVIAEFTEAGCNQTLSSFSAEYPEFAEIIITGRAGANACQSQQTLDYWQADEAWWVRTATEGRIWYGQLEFDRSSQAFGVSLYIPLWDPQARERAGPPVGIAKILVREP